MRGRYLPDTHAQVFYPASPGALPGPSSGCWTRPGTGGPPDPGHHPLDAGIALEAAHLELPHPDPADRFIAATAPRTAAVLVNRDERLRAHPKVASLWD